MKKRNTFLLAALIVASSLLHGRDDDGYPRVMQGPMVGAVTEDSVLIWVRGAWTWPIQVKYSEFQNMKEARTTEPVRPRKEDDYCLTIPLTGLRPDTQYYYRILVDGNEGKYLNGAPSFRVRTAPPEGRRSRFTVGYGSCARWQQDRIQPVWDAVSMWEPDLFFWLGDNVYADTLDPDIVAEEFRRQREVPGLAPLLTRIPQLATWDDHDFGLNNHDRTNPKRRENREVWMRYWPNPSHGTDAVEGIFFKYVYGGVDFYFLDNRYYRDPNEKPDGPGKTMLGKGQLDWLKKHLSASKAPFKVLISGSVWTRGKGPVGDAWSAFQHERDSLFDWIRDQSISGVVLLSGDTHTGELNVIPWSDRDGYDLYDLTASPLAQDPGNGWLFRDVEQRIRLPYNQAANFGWIEFDLTVPDPTLTFNIINTEAKPVWEPFVLRASELKNGVRSWPTKVSANALRWTEQLRGAVK